MNHGRPISNKKPGEGNPQKIKVLMYHRIVSEEELSHSYPWLCTHAQEFLHHLRLLERWGFTPITFEDYRLFQEGELNLPKKPVIITFDDGYLDTFEHAYPLLEEFGMKAVIFVLGDRNMRVNTWDQLAGLPMSPLLTEQQILEMHSAGFEIGSHSMTHTKLPELPHEKAWDEISRSRMLLEILLNAPVKTFAFPYGLTDCNTKKMVEDAGYAMACGTYSGPPCFGNDPFEVRRLFIPGFTNALRFATQMLTPYEYYAWARWRAKLLLIGNKQNGSTNGRIAPSKILSALNPAEKS
ncbi:MAG: polysaccharide deacetylase family protein [Ignavibacteria bacterium]|nr:polysaccharide deacetylase family protein [Ignavibacteria bacterium]MBI3765924.1 polysaccharide deacetylase family protein [Ignavibacteriales bacterium]